MHRATDASKLEIQEIPTGSVEVLAMVSLVASDKKEWLNRDCADLRKYAKRVIVDGEELPHYEADDQARLMTEVIDLAKSFKLTPRDLVRLIYG